jgi:Tol biopolymer transport system component
MSRDGQRVVATLRDQSGTRDLYSFDVASGRQTRLTFGSNPSTPRWVQGDRVLFQTGAPGTNARNFVALISGDGGGKPQELADYAFDPDISGDGRWLVFFRPSTGTGADILARSLDPTSLTPVQAQPDRPIVAGSGNERQPLLHPSGAFLAYVADDTGRPELYVTRFPDGQGKWQVSSGGVDYTTWTPSGDRLLYAQGGRVMEVAVKLGATVTIGTPRVVLEAAATRAVLDHTFDITTDDQLVFIRRPLSVGESVGTITVVQNWVEEFRGAGRQ